MKSTGISYRIPKGCIYSITFQEIQSAHEANRDLDLENQKLRYELILAWRKTKQFERAERLYGETISKLSQNPECCPSAAILGLRYEIAEMKIEQKYYEDAEVDARYVYEQRRSEEPASENSHDLKQSHRQLSFALRSQLASQKLKEAMMMHRKIWEEEGSEYHWRMENGDQLCLVYLDQEEYRTAERTQMEVWKERMRREGTRNKATMRSALQMISIWDKQISKVDQGLQSAADKRVDKEYFENKMRDFMKDIWDHKETPETNVEVLSIGHRLGKIHFQRKDYAIARAIYEIVWTGRTTSLGETHPDTLASGHEFGRSLFYPDGVDADNQRARLVLEQIWKARKSKLGESSSDTISSASYLALTHRRLGEYDLAEPINRWIWEQKKTASGEKSLSALGAFCDLGWNLYQQGRYQDAEIILRSIYQEPNTDPGREKLTLKSGHRLALTQSKQEGRINDAIDTIREVFHARKKTANTDDLAIMESGKLYGQWLTEKKGFDQAEAVLRPLWDRTITPPLEAAWLKIGDTLGQCLFKRGQTRQARDILNAVMHRKRFKYGVVDAAEFRTSATHLDADAELKSHPTATATATATAASARPKSSIWLKHSAKKRNNHRE